MQNRKRLAPYCKSNTDLLKPNVIQPIDEIFENDILPKYAKYEQTDYNHKSYFATPGECTRSKTTKYKINPFDLSNPEPQNITFDNFISSTRRNRARSKCRNNELNFCENSLDSGFDTESVSESILSFATKSSDENSRSSLLDSYWIVNSEQSLSTLKPTSSPVNNCSETGYLLPIASDSTHNVLIPEISSLTLANILSGNHTLDNNITIFDCRFPYEYSGGHIANAINVYTSQQLLQILFPIKQSCTDRKLEEDISNLNKKLKRDNTIYVFYCEFSSYRAPKM
uniref:Cell division cycle 25-1 n=1 Tax=Schmidtea mediterranea TaxID=79327 RepID=I1ZIE2_SCHMD|nr:cell division cycle 25-1 [Schmidtea mediterranea]